ncbi:MAG: ATP-binding protein [Candidatus Asgardarchaeum sp.]
MKAKRLGVILSDRTGPTHLQFNFQLDDDADVKVGEFVEVPLGSRIILGRIIRLHSINELFQDPTFIKDHLKRDMPLYARYPVDIGRWRAATVQIIGIIEDGQISPPNDAPEPGDTVYLASSDLLKQFLKLPEKGIYLGKMYGNNNIDIVLDIKRTIKHHIAVLGATGSGKSYTVGVIIEELLENNYPVVVIDTHGEYHGFNTPNYEEGSLLEKWGLEPKSYDIIRYSIFASYPGSKTLRISLDWLNADSFAEMLGATETQYDLLFLVFQNLKKEKMRITIDNVIESVDKVASEWKFASRTVFTIKRKLQLIRELGIIGTPPKIEELVSPGRLTIVDLSEDIEEKIRISLVGVLLDILFKARKKQIIPPLMVVVEESHRFAPQDEESYSKSMMRKIAREGRKFGIGLCLTSQRIVGLDKDVISQCGTKIILRIDSKTDLDYISPYISYSVISDLQRVPFLPNGVGIVSGIALKAPVIAQIRPRKSKHIGI